jgi:mannose-6-phosphate isomerase-like protein (cupin superfamily)
MKPEIRSLGRGVEVYTRERCYIIELANTPDDPAASIALARVSPGITTRWHRLVGTTERYVIIDGRGRVEVGDLAAREVAAGDVVLIPPLCPQRITNVGEHDLTFLAICTPRFEQKNYEEVEKP